MTDNIRTIYQVLDQNGDYFLAAASEGKIFDNIPFKLIDAALLKVFSFFDFSEDNSLSFTEDLPWSVDKNGSFYEDRNKDGKITFEELLSPPITWPAPLYKLYIQVDKDTNEFLSLEEARDFIKRTFTLIDTNSDCKISEEEIVAVTDTIGLPKSTGLAVKLILQQYTAILDYFFTQLILKGDTHELGRSTWDDIAQIEDWVWADSMVITVASLGHPNMGPIYHLMGMNLLDGHRGRRERREENFEML